MISKTSRYLEKRYVSTGERKRPQNEQGQTDQKARISNNTTLRGKGEKKIWEEKK